MVPQGFDEGCWDRIGTRVYTIIAERKSLTSFSYKLYFHPIIYLKNGRGGDFVLFPSPSRANVYASFSFCALLFEPLIEAFAVVGLWLGRLMGLAVWQSRH